MTWWLVKSALWWGLWLGISCLSPEVRRLALADGVSAEFAYLYSTGLSVACGAIAYAGRPRRPERQRQPIFGEPPTGFWGQR